MCRPLPGTTPPRDPLRSLRLDAESRVLGLNSVRTPAVIIDEVTVLSNIDVMANLIGSPLRWRAHCKTARSQRTVQLLLARGVRKFKTATIAETAAALGAGARDVLYALPASGSAQRDLLRLAEKFPAARVGALFDSPVALRSWAPGRLAAFLDLNSGMNRSGIAMADPDAARQLVTQAVSRGFEFAGLHHYDGHLAGLPEPDRAARTRDGLGRLSVFAAALDLDLPEVVTGGSHTFLPALSFPFPPPLRDRVTVSPGTVVYGDLRSLERLGDVGLRPAVGVLCRVVSTPTDRHVTVDAGLTAIQVDAGLPHAEVSGRPDAIVGAPSQAHLGLRFPSARPEIGELLVLMPRHVDTTLVQFDSYLAVGENGGVRPWPLPRSNPRAALRRSSRDGPAVGRSRQNTG